MEHLYNSPPVTLMALGNEHNIEEATKGTTTLMSTNETRNISVSSPLGSKARAKILDFQECLIMQGMPSADRIPGRFLQLRYMKNVVDLEQQGMLSTCNR